MGDVKLYTRRDLAKMASLGIVGTALVGRTSGVCRGLVGMRGGMIGAHGSPEPQLDRFEMDFVCDTSFIGQTSRYLGAMSAIDPNHIGYADNGDGNRFSFNPPESGSASWDSFVNNTYLIPSAGAYHRYAEYSGFVKIGLGLTAMPAKYALAVTRCVIPSWISTVTNANISKPYSNCSNITFVNRTYEQASALHANMVLIFPNAIWHCSDGDFNAT